MMQDLWNYIGTFIAGLLSGVGLKVVYDRSTRTTNVNQTGNVAGRDIVGGDVNKRTK